MQEDPIADFLDELRTVSEERYDLVFRIRKTVLDLDAKISEEIKYGGILFTMESPFCGIFSYTNHVSLEFGRGSELADPHSVLEGKGKSRRHIKITAQSDLYQKNVKAYVVLALENMKATRTAQRIASKRRS